MNTLKRIAASALVALFLSSCGFDINISNFGPGKKGNGQVVSETRNITENFTEVSASEGLSVYVTQADAFSVEVEADENIIDLIATDIKNGKLRVHARENIGKATKKIYVSLPEITALQSSSGAQLQSETTLTGDEIEVDGSSGAQLKLDLKADSIEIDASSGANLNLSGEADRAEVDVSSGGNINAKDLQTKACTADASSGGNLKIRVSESLVADASSGGNISYSGEPKVQKKKSFSGSVDRY
ncbi:head GIN domain-containing protein [Pricia sp. S334]|uniref:Head GIN domain-containing protein n=1 Tax=Pricia mediterranea TaxID=3076079 RepID=A0ABU3L038_9FLAO|nr:head GIN domain-containing protein [Pricia sp. S334]MDT7827090.1 head GIN domain-containing protein [Pricia sp. S334]